MTVLLAIGTGKGLFLARSADNRRNWQVSGPHFPMTAVYSFAIDTRRRPTRLLAGVTSSHFGPSVATSDDLGETWDEPEHAPIAFPADTEAALEQVWQLAPGRLSEPDVVYAGVQPSALFRSEDGGRSFELVRGLWDHPHRPQWTPGFGGKAVHTVLPHPTVADELLVAMSTGGVYRSKDAGVSWAASNTGIRAYFMPENEYPEFGQCVHKVARNPDQPERYFAQNHHGVYRSEDAGGSWSALSAGLPEHPYYASVLRDAMACDDADPAGVYFGSRAGEVYASPDEGESWQLVAAHLPDVLCVRAAVVD
jgi:hypothetical protein